MHDAIFLSAKSFISLGFAAILTTIEPLISQLPVVDESMAQYGVLGVVCLICIYAIKTLFNINQGLQKDNSAERLQANKDRLADRDMFFQRLEKHFEAGQETRQQLIDSNSKTATAITQLAEQMKGCGIRNKE
jgi:hypothetical protein